MIEKKDLNVVKNRKEIYDYIKKYPGIHLNELFRQLKMSDSTIRYHLKYLISHELIIGKKENSYIRYYLTYSISNGYKNIIGHLRIETTRNILLHLLIKGCASQKELAKELDKANSTIDYHLKKLIDGGIVEETTVEKNLVRTNYKILKYLMHNVDGREIVYILKDPYLIYDVFIFFQDKLFDNGDTELLLNYFKEFFGIKDIIKNHYDENANNILDMIMSYLTCPYYI